MTAIEFNTLVVREKKPLRNYAYQLTRNTDDADDLLQDTMLKAFIYKEKFVDSVNLKGWLFTIMKNNFINNYRRDIKRNTFLDKTDNTFFLDSVALSVPNSGENTFALRDINNAIEQLTDDLKNVIKLNNIGFKYHEIAEMLTIPIGTVKTRIFVARRILRKKLKDYGVALGFKEEN